MEEGQDLDGVRLPELVRNEQSESSVPSIDLLSRLDSLHEHTAAHRHGRSGTGDVYEDGGGGGGGAGAARAAGPQDVFSLHMMKAQQGKDDVVKGMRRNIQALCNQLKRGKSIVATLETKLKLSSQTNKMLRDENKKLSDTVTELSERLLQMETDIDDPEQDTADGQHSAENGMSNSEQIAQLQEQLQGREKRILELMMHNKRLLTELISARQETKVQETEAARLKEELEKALQKLALVEGETNTVDQLQQDLANAQAAVETLTKERDELRTECGFCKAETRAVTAKCNQYSQELELKTKRNTELSQRVAELEEQLQAQTREFTTALQEKDQCMLLEIARREAAERQVVELEQELARRAADMSQVQEELERTRVHATAQDVKIRDMAQAQERTEAELRELRNEAYDRHVIAREATPEPAVSAADQFLSRVAKDLYSTIVRLIETEEAAEASCSCQHCLELAKDPVILCPCSHWACRGCVEAFNETVTEERRHGNTGTLCPVCYKSAENEMGALITDMVRNAPLAQIVAKFKFKMQALNAVRRTTNTLLQIVEQGVPS